MSLCMDSYFCDAKYRSINVCVYIVFVVCVIWVAVSDYNVWICPSQNHSNFESLHTFMRERSHTRDSTQDRIFYTLKRMPSWVVLSVCVCVCVTERYCFCFIRTSPHRCVCVYVPGCQYLQPLLFDSLDSVCDIKTERK